MKNYWFARTGILSTEAGRIALALSFLLINYKADLISADVFYHASVNTATYAPKGIIAIFFPQNIPNDSWVDAMILISKVAPWLLLLGLFSRPALFATVLSHLFLQTLRESFSENWSHGYNVVLLCGLAFMFAPVGQLFSVDAWIRKKKGRIKTFYRNGFNYVLLAQWAVALMFFSAFCHKILFQRAVFHFDWIFSDNLRHHLVDSYTLCGRNMPAYVAYIASTPFLYKTIALLNCIFQLLPVMACFCIHRPALRAVFGLAFVIEEIGLGLLMQLNDYHWYPLYLFFIDWDYFLGYAQLHTMTTLKKTKRIYAIAFIGIYVFFSLKVSDMLFGFSAFDAKAYPFSQFSMFSNTISHDRMETAGIEFMVWFEQTERPGNLYRDPNIEQNILARFYPMMLENNFKYHHKTVHQIKLLLDEGEFGFDQQCFRVRKIQIFCCTVRFTEPPQAPGVITLKRELSVEKTYP